MDEDQKIKSFGATMCLVTLVAAGISSMLYPSHIEWLLPAALLVLGAGVGLAGDQIPRGAIAVFLILAAPTTHFLIGHSQAMSARVAAKAAMPSWCGDHRFRDMSHEEAEQCREAWGQMIYSMEQEGFAPEWTD